LDELLRLLSTHVAAEKQLLVPVLLDHSDEGKALAGQLGDDHMPLKSWSSWSNDVRFIHRTSRTSSTNG
jgi:hypothetical protein